MANVYYGDGGFSGVTGNWNTISNWFVSLGGQVCCGCNSFYVPGTPLGRLPNATTDTVVLTLGRNVGLAITTGPTGGYSGPMSVIANVSPYPLTIAAGVYSGTFTIPVFGEAVIDAGATFTGPLFIANSMTINSGSVNSAITVSGSSTVLTINGGNFNASTFAISGLASIVVKGGSWSPVVTATVDLATKQLVVAALPKDPGFALRGTYSPTISISNMPDILGAGLL